MNVQTIVQLVGYILLAVCGGISLWLSGNAVVNRHVTAFIREAEALYKDQTKAGGIKFQWVVDKLYNLIPTIIKPFIPVSVIEDLVQATFDAVESYAKMQLDKLADKVIK